MPGIVPSTLYIYINLLNFILTATIWGWYRWGNWGREKWRNLPKVIQLIISMASKWCSRDSNPGSHALEFLLLISRLCWMRGMWNSSGTSGTQWRGRSLSLEPAPPFSSPPKSSLGRVTTWVCWWYFSVSAKTNGREI